MRVHPRCMQGFSLIELMVALTLGLLLMAMLGALFVDVSRANREMARVNDRVEGARLAMQLLRDDLQHAGYWGGFVPEFDDLDFDAAPSDVPVVIPDPCAPYAGWDAEHIQSLIGVAVQSHASTSGSCTLIRGRVEHSDVLVVRHADTCATTQTGCATEVAGKVYFQPSRCAFEIERGIHHVLAATGLELHARQCTDGVAVSGAAAPRFRYISNLYYVRDWAVTEGDGIPTLVRSAFDTAAGVPAQQPAVPLVEGIEALRIEIGVDHLGSSGGEVITAADPTGRYTAAIAWGDALKRRSPLNRGDGTPDAFVHCADDCSVDQFANTVAVRIHLLARAIERTPGYVDGATYRLGDLTLGPFNDGFGRHVFSGTVRLPNVAGRRETP